MGLRPIFCFLEVMNKVPQGLQTLVDGFVGSLGYDLWGVELLPRPKSGQLLRVYIETQPQDGVDLSDCEKVSRQLSAVLDVEDPIAGEYTLEVSSPGMDRPLYNIEQFARYVDATVRVKLRSTVVGRKNFRGQLLAVEQGQIQMLVDGEQITLAISDIDSAHVVPQF
jgi:ribosome maturation factor RimP